MPPRRPVQHGLPKNYMEKVGEDGFRRQPVGLGPYRFSRMSPGVELVLEANEQYWRKKPSIKRVIIKGVPDRTTRLAMLKTGEEDIGYLMVGLEAATIKADMKLRLAKIIPPAAWWLEFPEQWNAKSPWYDRRVRLAATLAAAVWLFERLGFLLTMISFLALTMRVLGKVSWPKSIVLALVGSVAAYVVFGRVLRIALPSGILPY
jgi:Bacterial extracellular solute-binding proteins, family 5 Middle/Tripartite tricarboxylate transporter TctB family